MKRRRKKERNVWKKMEKDDKQGTEKGKGKKSRK